MDVLLIAGLWLDGSAWDAVVPQLRALGHQAVPVWLPGQGVPPTTATLADQHAAVLAAVDAAAGDVVVVGHSAACTLAWMAADARPDKVARVVLIGGFPSEPGSRARSRRSPPLAAVWSKRSPRPPPAAKLRAGSCSAQRSSCSSSTGSRGDGRWASTRGS